MYEELAWENFLKTGDIECFLEYKKIKELSKSKDNDSDVEKEENCD